MTPKRLEMVLPILKQNILKFFSEILNLGGHLNRCFGSKLRVILQNGWILPTGGVAFGRVCYLEMQRNARLNIFIALKYYKYFN